ncbi:DinB family protein [Geomonas paludis]|uniref:DinB family protein n=1 Tax=Geomonas paludis TaxID=2740185 RepID=A0A6V8MVH1_9BACT|nr:DinB family protein [Geomonas paludis]UPU37594.1 DinB family protein [Geomonas paludis]GFO63874.1 hypothetical protein GMPD_17930 [Geomonas paludis]
MTGEATMRKELLALLEGGNAHFDFKEVLADLPPESINAKAANTPYSLWHFVEHLRIAQWDILEFIRTPAHRSPEYPAGYRPAPDRTTDQAGWRESCDRFLADLEALKDLVRDETLDLMAPLPHAPGYSIFREVLLAADHNAYHIGEIAILRQVMGLWPAHNRYLTGSAD